MTVITILQGNGAIRYFVMKQLFNNEMHINNQNSDNEIFYNYSIPIDICLIFIWDANHAHYAPSPYAQTIHLVLMPVMSYRGDVTPQNRLPFVQLLIC